MIVPDWAGYLSFRDAFLKVLDPRLHTIGWLDGRVLNGTAYFARSDAAAIVFEVRTYPTGFREVHGLLAAGELDQIVNELIPAAEAWGRENSCQGAVIESRPGWVKQLKSSGYQISQVAIRKDL